MKQTMTAKGFFSLLIAFALLTLAPQCPDNGDDNDKNGGGGGSTSWVARGGNAVTQFGGNGGVVQLAGIASGGDLAVDSGGAPGPGFNQKPPVPPRPYLGYNPWIVTDDYEVQVYINGADADANAAVGDYLMFLGTNILLYKQANGVYPIVTGLQINPGVILTLGLNDNNYGATGQDTAEIQFSNDFVNRGTLTAQSLDTGNLNGGVIETIAGLPATARDRGGLDISASNIINAGLIDQTGDPGVLAADRGGFGGLLDLLGASGMFQLGQIDLVGGPGGENANGGDAGDGQMVATFGPALVTGRIDASGGPGKAGGDGGQVIFGAQFGSCFNTASHSANGGEGENGNGGDGGMLAIVSGSGLIKNTGDQQINGGDAHGTGGPVLAGNAGGMMIQAGNAFNSGRIHADGGDAFINGQGGAGGSFGILMAPVPSTRLINQASFTGRGGDAAGVWPGGGGGRVQVANPNGPIAWRGSIDISSGDGELTPPPPLGITLQGSSISVFGLAGGVHLDGGDGTNGGGGGIMMASSASGDYKFNVPFFAAGGEGLTLNGGLGGGLVLVTGIGDLLFRGKVHVPGGDALAGAGGPGGVLQLIVLAGDLDFNGVANLEGGDSGGGGVFNGGPGGVFICAGDLIDARGTVHLDGGLGVNAGIGGHGGIATLSAADHAVVSVNLFVPGGDGDDTVGVGGIGGTIVITSTANPPSAFTGRYDAAGGIAQTNGADGTVTVDGVLIWP